MNLNQQLFNAVRQTNAPACLDLLARGADVHAVNKGGLTVLHWAARLGRADICLILLEQGAHYQTKNNEGKMALDLATENKEDGGVCANAIRPWITAQAARTALWEMTPGKALKVDAP